VGAAMAKVDKNVASFLNGYEKAAAKKLRELQTTQSFGGALKINLDRVFIDRKDGLRALDQLRQINPDRLAKAK
jgi:hypothetical protein